MQNKIEVVKVFDDKFQNLVQFDSAILEHYDASTNNAAFKQEEIKIVEEPKAEGSLEKTILSCSYCKVEFPNVSQQRDHYKLDWHRYNLKQHLNGRPTISEYEFENKNDDVSSISGSESESEVKSENSNVTYLAQNQGRIYVTTHYGPVLLLYRCLLAEKKQEIVDLQASLTQLKNANWAVLMLGGGHFAGAIFDETNAILHKTFHCYTVRAGQGGAQSSRDNKNASSAPKSAGASLRRYNEQALVQHVTGIMDLWKDELAKCTVIAYRAPGPYNKNVLFGGKSPVLTRGDVRLRVIPFPTRRATYSEVKRVHDILSNATIYDSIDSIPKELPDDKGDGQRRRNKSKSVVLNRAKSRESVERQLPCDDLDDSLGISQTLSTDSVSEMQEDMAMAMEDLEVSFEEALEPFGDSLTPEQRRAEKPKKKSGSRKTQLHHEKQAKLKEEKQRVKIETEFKLNLYNSIVTNNLGKFIALLKNHPELVNLPIDLANNTALHLCAEMKKPEFIETLLLENVDLCAKNAKHQTPYTMTQDKQVREMFKQFAQVYPDKFNYSKAQIPVSEALTPMQLEERKLKQQQMKKARREKEKERKKLKKVDMKEQEERVRFAGLSDREKRALAAERRILNISGTVISRCFLCGDDMSGRVPYEYSGNRFCSIECLKGHRMTHPIVLS